MRFTNKMMGVVAILVASVTAGVVGVAAAQEGSGKATSVVAAERKANHDERKAKREERKAEMLAKFDLNKDGVLDASERAAMKQAMVAKRFEKLDTNRDGMLSLAEFEAGAQGKGMHKHARHHRGHGVMRKAPTLEKIGQ